MEPSQKLPETKPGLLMPLVTPFLSNEVLKGSAGEKTNAELTRCVKQFDRNQAIDLVRLALRLTHLALTAFSNRQVHLFDPLVGENACQIRAHKLAYMLLTRGDKLSEKISETVKTIDVIDSYLAQVLRTSQLSETNTPFLHIAALGNDVRLKEALQSAKLKLNPYLCEEQQFLTYAYLLTLTRDANKPMETNELNLSQLTTSFMQPLIFRDITLTSKSALSRLSLLYLQKQVIPGILDCPPKEKTLLSEMAKAVKRAGGNIMASPCYFNLFAILKKMMTDQMTVVLRAVPLSEVGKVLGPPMHCTLRGNGDHFTLLTPQEIEARLQSPAIVFEGVCQGDKALGQNYFANLLGHTDRLDHYPHSRLMQIVLANGAAHPQYAGDSKTLPIALFCKSDEDEGVDLQKMLKEIAVEAHGEESEIQLVLERTSKRDKAQALCKQVDLFELAKSYVRLEQMKALALREGLCAENPTLFSLKHIYCDTLEHLFHTGGMHD